MLGFYLSRPERLPLAWRNQRTVLGFGFARSALLRLSHRPARCGTGIWPDRDIAARRAPHDRHARLSRPRYLLRPAHPRESPAFRRPRRASAARSDRRKAARALTSAARLARSADRARFCLTRSEFKDLPHIKPEKGPTSLRSAWHRRHLITGGAVLEYGPTEILSPVSPMLPRPVCLCRPRPLVPAWTPRKTAASRPRKANSRERQVRT